MPVPDYESFMLPLLRRGVYRITDAGRAVLAERPKEISKAYLKRFEPFRDFLALRRDAGEDDQVDDGPTLEATATPEEQLEGAYRRIRQKVEADVLEAVATASPQFFEKLVIELLVKMGYGGTIADAGEALGRTGDGGIDGVIKEDKLGLDAIYVQAKRWQNTVGRPEVQGFAGSLLGRRGRKGVFITTSTFSKEAREYVGQIESKIILIDGPTLAGLMVDHDIGVNTVDTYAVKRVDSDYFSEE
jgi:restriction system protein